MDIKGKMEVAIQYCCDSQHPTPIIVTAGAAGDTVKQYLDICRLL